MNVGIGLTAAAMLAASTAQAVTSCDRLVAYASGLPASIWASGDKALAPALTFEADRSAGSDGKPTTALERRVADLPEVREALGLDQDADAAMRVEHLAGTDLFALTSVQGTMHCSTSAFVRARQAQDVHVIPGPKALDGDDNDICWTTGEGLATAFGAPVHVVHDLILPTATTANFTITPWAGGGWAAACRARLTFRAKYTLTDHYCGDEAVCALGADEAVKIAAAYNKLRETSDPAAAFAYGPPPPESFADRLTPVKLAPAGGDFPTFGGAAGNEPGYGGSGHILFPLQLGDHWYAASVGRGGVGWREDDTTLLAIFSLEGRTLTPLASYVVTRSLAGLESAKVVAAGD